MLAHRRDRQGLERDLHPRWQRAQSGAWFRVDARLVRADGGCVIWSKTYDQPLDNILAVQDDIADKMTKALKASIEDQP